MNRILLLAGLASVLAFGVIRLRAALASDEDRVRRVFDEMIDAAEDGNPRRFMSSIDRDRYADATSSFDADDLRQALNYLFLAEKLKLDVTLESLEVTVDPDATPPAAQVRYRCRIDELQPGGATLPWWSVSGTGVLEEREGEWRLVRTDDIDHSTRPRR